jgi:arylsulfatase A-like enzyme/Flp pilus assembly protein TadD
MTFSLFAQSPNVILITLDTTRADHIGCYISKEGLTPNIDDIAKKGVLFEEARCSVPLTLPSHANILTGKLPSSLNLRVNGLELNPKHTLIQELLKKKGYKTVAVVSSIILEKTRGLSRGFDIYNDKMTKIPKGGGPPEERRAEETTTAALQEMEKVNSPYFLWVHYYDPHFDYNPPSPFKEQFKDNLYDGEIAYMDSEIGKLLKGLSDKGKLKNTLIVIVGDHGEGLMEHKERQHGVFIYEYALHIPLIMYYEGVLPSNKKISEMVSVIDIAPTIADVVNSKIDGVDGRSLLPLIKENKWEEKPQYIETYHGYFNYGWSPLRGIIDREYKFIDAPKPELYKYRESEFKNLYTEKADIAKKMRKELEKYPPADEGEKKELENFLKDPSNAENLKALMSLGYLSGSGMNPNQQGLIDPKDGITMEEELRTAQEIRDSGDLEKAKQMLLAIIKRNPTNVPALSILGGIYLYENKLEEAKVCFLEQLKLKPQMDGAHLNLGTVYKKLGNLTLAEKEYRAALVVNPRMTEAVANLSQLLINQNRMKEAKEILENAINNQMEDSDIYFEAGVLYAMESNFERARYCFTKSVSLNPMNHLALANLGKIAYKQNKYDEAISYYERASRIASSNPEYYATIGSLYLNGKNDIDKAIFYFRKAVAADPYGKSANELRQMIQGLEAERNKKQ